MSKYEVLNYIFLTGFVAMTVLWVITYRLLRMVQRQNSSLVGDLRDALKSKYK